MILGSKASTYAILAVTEIARHQHEDDGGFCMRAAEIAKHFGLPAAYAAKVMTQLVRADVLHSDRGPRGGFRLTRPPEEISILDIVEAVDGHFEAEHGVLSSPAARTALTGVNEVFEGVVSEVRDLLSKKSIADLGGFTAEPAVAELPQLSH